MTDSQYIEEAAHFIAQGRQIRLLLQVRSAGSVIRSAAMPEAPPPDTEQVRYAFRLGWVIAELRGRYRPDRFGKREPGNQSALLRKDFELPLSNERSQTEIRIELFDAAEDLSRELKLNPRDEHGHPLLEQIKPLMEAMEAAEDTERPGLWKGSQRKPGLAYHFFKWDAQNQDELVLGATQAAAYQLGRGLAETYWALHPERPGDKMGSWEAVLGERRRDTLLRLSGRLSTYIGPLVLAAIDESVRAWSALATTTDPLACRSSPPRKIPSKRTPFRTAYSAKDCSGEI